MSSKGRKPSANSNYLYHGFLFRYYCQLQFKPNYGCKHSYFPRCRSCGKGIDGGPLFVLVVIP